MYFLFSGRTEFLQIVKIGKITSVLAFQEKAPHFFSDFYHYSRYKRTWIPHK